MRLGKKADSIPSRFLHFSFTPSQVYSISDVSEREWYSRVYLLRRSHVVHALGGGGEERMVQYEKPKCKACTVPGKKRGDPLGLQTHSEEGKRSRVW